MKWTFDPVYPENYTHASPKVLVVGPEPNDRNPRPELRDMGRWFRTASIENCFWDNPTFYWNTVCHVAAVGGTDRDKVLHHVRYIDLKAEGGDAAADLEEVTAATKGDIDHVIEYWTSDRPDVTILQGNISQVIFREVIAANLSFDTRVIGLPHPSRFMCPHEVLKEVNKYLRAFREGPYRWSAKSRSWELF